MASLDGYTAARPPRTAGHAHGLATVHPGGSTPGVMASGSRWASLESATRSSAARSGFTATSARRTTSARLASSPAWLRARSREARNSCRVGGGVPLCPGCLERLGALVEHPRQLADLVGPPDPGTRGEIPAGDGRSGRGQVSQRSE